MDFWTPMKWAMIIAVVSTPLALWKVVDIIVWVTKNIAITIK
jgi:hypothetical protein